MDVVKEREMLPASTARSSFASLLKRSQYKGDRIIVSVHGEPVAAIVPYEDLLQLERLEDHALGTQATQAIEDTDDDILVFEDII